MGLYLHAYVGPYVRCRYRPAKRAVEVRGCTRDPSHGLDRDAGFCPRCGAPAGPVPKAVDDRPSFHEVVGDDVLVELSSGTGGVLWLGSNQRRSPVRDLHPDARGSEVHEDVPSPESVAAEIAWFSEAYAEPLRLMRAVYDSVEVRWGVHLYHR